MSLRRTRTEQNYISPNVHSLRQRKSGSVRFQKCNMINIRRRRKGVGFRSIAFILTNTTRKRKTEGQTTFLNDKIPRTSAGFFQRDKLGRLTPNVWEKYFAQSLSPFPHTMNDERAPKSWTGTDRRTNDKLHSQSNIRLSPLKSSFTRAVSRSNDDGKHSF